VTENKPGAPVVDCCTHCALPGLDALFPHLPAPWPDSLKTSQFRPMSAQHTYPGWSSAVATRAKDVSMEILESQVFSRADLAILQNSFFGPRVRVSGLLTGGDIVANAHRFTGDIVILPSVMLDKTGSRLLDGMTPAELVAQIHKPVYFAGYLSEVDDVVFRQAPAEISTRASKRQSRIAGPIARRGRRDARTDIGLQCPCSASTADPRAEAPRLRLDFTI